MAYPMAYQPQRDSRIPTQLQREKRPARLMIPGPLSTFIILAYV